MIPGPGTEAQTRIQEVVSTYQSPDPEVFPLTSILAPLALVVF